MDLVAGTEQAWGSILELLESLQEDEWSRATPCEAWDVRDIAAHLGAVEGGFMGFPQPPVPDGWSGGDGIDGWTAAGIAARQDWSNRDIIDEVRRAADARIALLEAAKDEAGWSAPAMGP